VARGVRCEERPPHHHRGELLLHTTPGVQRITTSHPIGTCGLHNTPQRACRHTAAPAVVFSVLSFSVLSPIVLYVLCL